jgi:hypothetical protein
MLTATADDGMFSLEHGLCPRDRVWGEVRKRGGAPLRVKIAATLRPRREV